MMTQKQFRLSAVAAALATVFGTAMADSQVDELIKPDSSISIGVGHWSNDRPQSGMYDGMSEGKTYGLFDADITKRDDATGTWYKLDARDLGVSKNWSIKGEVLKQGDIGISAEWARSSRQDPLTYHTNVQGLGTTNQVFPNPFPTTTATDWANKTGRFAPQLNSVDLGITREKGSLKFYKNLMPGLDFSATFENEDKTGGRNRNVGRLNNGNTGVFGVEPIDSTTRQLETALSWTTEKFQLRGGYNGSWYANNIAGKQVFSSLAGIAYGGGTIDNSVAYQSLPLDNEAHQFFVNGGYNFTKGTRGTFKLEYGRATQDDRYPTAGLAAFYPNDFLAGAPTSLNAKIVTTLAELGLTSRITKEFSVNANLRYYKRDDQTPVNFNYDYVPANNGQNGGTYIPTSYKTLTGKLEAIYRFADVYSLVGGIEEKRQDRDLPMWVNGAMLNAATPAVNPMTDGAKPSVVAYRTQLNETTGRLELRRSLTDTVNGSVSWIHAKRDGSRYRALEPGVGSQIGAVNTGQSLINPLHVADRTRNKGRLAVDWTPVNDLSLQFVVENGKDTYGGPGLDYGLDNGKTLFYSLDAAWTINEKLSVNAWYSYDQSKARITGLTNRVLTATTTNVKQADLEDNTDSFGLGIKWEAMSNLHLGANFDWILSTSKYDQQVWGLISGVAVQPANGGVAAPNTGLMPNVTDKHRRVSLFAVYALDKSSDLRLDLKHDKWSTNDWSWQYTDGSPYIMGDGTYVTTKPNQSATFVGMRYIYKFQ